MKKSDMLCMHSIALRCLLRPAGKALRSVVPALCLLLVGFVSPCMAAMQVPDGSPVAAYLSFGVLLGLFLALVVNGLHMFCVLRKGCYVWYAVLMAWLAGYLLLLHPLVRGYLDTLSLGVMQGVVQLAFAGVVIAGGSFARSFMQTAGQSEDLLSVDRLLLLAILLGCCLMLAASPTPAGRHDQVFILLALGAAVVVVVATLLAWQKGVTRARYLFLAGLVAAGGWLVQALVIKGGLETLVVQPDPFAIGCVGGSLLLGCALGDNVKALHHETEFLRVSERRHMTLAVTDDLTGLFNVRYFRTQIALEMRHAKQAGQPFTLMMMDVDNFKVFNDRYGHLEGDRVLRQLGRQIQAQVRSRDVACRYGGEEFAILLPGGRSQDAIQVHTRLRRALRQWSLEDKGDNSLPVTLSVGVAQYAFGEAADELIARADRAMYAAKNSGRDQLVLAGTDGAR